MRSGGEARGNAVDRRRRKAWLLATFGTGRQAPCRWCGKRLRMPTVEADRYPVAGRDGGRYVHGNIVPACRRCNAGRTPPPS